MFFKGKEHQGAGTAINQINEKRGYPRLIFGTDVTSSQHNCGRNMASRQSVCVNFEIERAEFWRLFCG